MKSAKIVRLQTKRVPKRPHKKPEPMPDALFFIKAQISVGTTFEHFGRLDPGSLWDVNRIVTDEPTASGVTRSKSVKTVQRFNDTVYLTRRGSNSEKRQGSFGYLCYSAIWRLPRGGG